MTVREASADLVWRGEPRRVDVRVARAPKTEKRGAVGVVHTSPVGEGASGRVVSLDEQCESISDACKRDGLELLATFDEPGISGGAPLEGRPALSKAVAMIEGGEADVVVVAYFDRLVRSLAVQREIVERVEQAGGAVVALDIDEFRSGAASRWLSSPAFGMVADLRRAVAERTAEAKRRSVERGVPPFPSIPVGYRRRQDRTLEPDPETAPIVREMFELRARGAPWSEIRRRLQEHGVDLGYRTIGKMLSNRIYLGELRFGALVNPAAHVPIVDTRTFAAVQRMRAPRGRRAKSERLLARLGVLRCGTCGARMVVGTTRANGRDYPMYRCPPNGDCPQRVTISAERAEHVVSDAVRAFLEGSSGTASLEDEVADAERELERAEREVDAAVEAFSGLDDVSSARERLLALRDECDRARDRLAELQAAAVPAVTASASGDWDSLTLDERRALIRAVVDRATVSPGRGPDRISVHLRHPGRGAAT